MTTKTVVSKSTKRRGVPKGSKNLQFTQMVIYQERLPNGKTISKTKHEVI